MIAPAKQKPALKPAKKKLGRARIHDPEFDTPAGELAWWIRHNMPQDATGKQLGEALGRAGTAGFRWLNGESIPPVEDWGAIAKFLGLGSRWTDLVPPPEFVSYLHRYRRLPTK